MPKATVWYGIGLIIFGAVAYTAVGMVTFSVLTPAYYGIALSTAGTVALKEKSGKNGMHIAGVIALLGIFDGLASLVPAMLCDNGLDGSAITEMLMAVSMAVFLGFCVRSFIEGKKAPGEA